MGGSLHHLSLPLPLCPLPYHAVVVRNLEDAGDLATVVHGEAEQETLLKMRQLRSLWREVDRLLGRRQVVFLCLLCTKVQ